ncbi:MAG: RNA polymerase sigma factor [Vicinamibacterales bacterium]
MAVDPNPHNSPDSAPLTSLAERIAQGDHRAFESMMREHNGRLFRVARAIVKDDTEVEDVLQEAYLDAYRHIGQFRGDSALSTWLTRIVVNHALMRLRRKHRDRTVVAFDDRDGAHGAQTEANVPDLKTESPSSAVLRDELRQLIERRIDELPLNFRTVFVMREIEDLTVEETADCLSIPPSTVRTRLFRARALLREALARDVDTTMLGVFAFAGARCDRIVAGVLTRLLEREEQPDDQNGRA